MFNFLRKAIAICMVGFGLGILMSILLPLCGWLFIIGIIIIIVGLICLSK